MIEAHSLASIVQAVDQQLGEEEVDLPFEPPSLNTDLFIPGSPFADATGGSPITVVTEQWSKLIGILFCQPGTRLAREEIMPNLDYFHYRSGFFVDFFCAGYSAQWDVSSSQHHEPEAIVRGVPWLFNAKDFNSLRREIEDRAKWNYTGEAELVLLAARKPRDGLAILDFSVAIACNLERMQKDEAFTSVRAFFEQIFRFGETYDGEDPVWQLSDKQGIGVGKNVLRDAILGILPESLQKLYKSARHYAVRDISK